LNISHNFLFTNHAAEFTQPSFIHKTVFPLSLICRLNFDVGNKMKKFIAVIFLFAIRFSVFAGNPSNDVLFVSGNVTDQKTHETLAGVQVHVAGTNINVYTDFDGNFFLPDLPRGSYQLEFHYITYQTTQVVTDPATSGCNYCTTLSVEISQN
jgi:hypothetical protein